MKVLVTGAGALLGQGVIRSLLEGQLGATVVAVDPSPLAPGLYWTPHRALVPFANDPTYVERFEELLRRERPDVVIPGTDVELTLFAAHRHAWERDFGTHVLISSSEVVTIADDKYLTFSFLRDHGFSVPDSCLAGQEEELLARVGFPLVVKPRIGARSVGMSVVRDREELARAVRAGTNVVIQECVATGDDEYTAGSLTFDGKCDATIVMRRDLRDGNTYRAYVDHFPELNEQVRRFAAALGAYGPANFQFRLDRDGNAKVFEINARFSGTTPLRMRAGFNEVELSLRRIVNGERVAQPAVEPMTIVRWFSETVIPRGGEPRV
jgi:carbamoyl-phosphate synthase large subunit